MSDDYYIDEQEETEGYGDKAENDDDIVITISVQNK